MRTPRLYVDQSLEAGSELIMPSAQAHYIATVLRLSTDRPVILFNGQGGEYEATLTQCTKKQVVAQIGTFIDGDRESPLVSELAIGISRGDRMDLIVQKATELGVTRIVPLFTERTEVKLKADRLDKKIQHWQQIMISACEQCQRNKLVDIATPQVFSEYLTANSHSLKLILHPTQQGFSPNDVSACADVALLIGPEGGFSEQEVADALQQGFKGWILGPRILRTETAPIAALSILQQRWGDF